MNSSGIKVALVDDSSLIRNCIHEILKAWGYQIVLEAINGKDFFKQLTTANAPDICITDINMPEMNGFETIKQLKQQWPDIKIVAFSITGQAEADRAIRTGADAFVSKLSPIAELHKILKSMSNATSTSFQ